MKAQSDPAGEQPRPVKKRRSRLSAPQVVVKWYGSVKGQHDPDDWRKLREDFERGMAKDANRS